MFRLSQSRLRSTYILKLILCNVRFRCVKIVPRIPPKFHRRLWKTPPRISWTSLRNSSRSSRIILNSTKCSPYRVSKFSVSTAHKFSTFERRPQIHVFFRFILLEFRLFHAVPQKRAFRVFDSAIPSLCPRTSSDERVRVYLRHQKSISSMWENPRHKPRVQIKIEIHFQLYPSNQKWSSSTPSIVLAVTEKNDPHHYNFPHMSPESQSTFPIAQPQPKETVKRSTEKASQGTSEQTWSLKLS